jgi:hypothetical protein
MDFAVMIARPGIAAEWVIVMPDPARDRRRVAWLCRAGCIRNVRRDKMISAIAITATDASNWPRW